MPLTGFLCEMSKNKTQIFTEISKNRKMGKIIQQRINTLSNLFRIKDETHLCGKAEDLLHQLLSL